jgi:hypothetical protein
MPVQPLASKSPSYWALHLAIAEASKDSREAPWYGPWNIVLNDLFQDFGPSRFFTVTYPQFSLVKDFDAVNSDEEESDEVDDNKAGL